MKRYLAILLIALAWGCNNSNSGNMQSNDKDFDSFKNRFVEDLWSVYPAWATSVGFHKYDSLLSTPDDQQRKMELQFADQYLDSLKRFSLNDLSEENRIDHHMMTNYLEGVKWGINTFKAYEWDPSIYNVGETFALLLSENYAPLDERLHRLNVKLAAVPAYYSAAKKNINKPTIPHTDLAIEQNEGSLSVFTEMLADSLKNSKLTDVEKSQIRERSSRAVDAIKEYVSWLKTEVRPKLNEQTARDFRIGKDLFDQKFAYDLESSFTPEQLYEKAMKRKEEVHAEMEKRSRELWPKYFANKPMPANRLDLIKCVLDTISKTHANPDNFRQSVEKQLPELVKFINDKKLLFIDPEKPLVVRQTPDYQAGVSVASINAPGPYDKKGNTYYNVINLKPFTPEKAESFLREYNIYTLQIINIHEAIPGHYTQLVYSNNSPSIIKSIFGSGSMVEGWAVYAERMMMEEGYGNNSPELWLMYYKWHLRAICNTLLDYGLHVKHMTQEEAMHLMVEEGFQQLAEAEGKYKRASLSQVQLCSYFNGYSEIYDLREDYKKKLGSKFNLREFHDKFLSYGSAPVKYIREAMME